MLAAIARTRGARLKGVGRRVQVIPEESALKGLMWRKCLRRGDDRRTDTFPPPTSASQPALAPPHLFSQFVKLYAQIVVIGFELLHRLHHRCDEAGVIEAEGLGWIVGGDHQVGENGLHTLRRRNPQPCLAFEARILLVPR